MAKLKTRKSVSSRVKRTKTGKYRRRAAGQSHFNSRDTGKDTRRKRSDFSIAKSEHRAFREMMPYA
jgi:ribosomal protein L35